MVSMYQVYQERKAGSTKIDYQQKILRNGQAGLKNNQMELPKGKVCINFFKKTMDD